MQYEAAETLLKSILDFQKASYGPSGDTEHDAACEMRDSAIAYLLASAGRDLELAELIDDYEKRLELIFDGDETDVNG